MNEPLMSAYARLPIAFERGEGARLWDTAGNEYLDALAGVAVCGLGHAHPAITQIIREQAGLLLHTSNLYRIPWQEALATQLNTLAGMERAFFANSGAEANEAALKIARRYGHGRGIDSPKIIVMTGSFHGRTLATLSATGNSKIHAGFEPLVQNFIRVPYNDVSALEQLPGQLRQDVVAVLLEPIQGEGGIVVPDDTYLDQIRAICDTQDWLLMLDEVQTGLCRTGRWFAFQHSQSQPDVMTLAKSLGNGIPIGVCLARGEAAQVIQPGSHGSTCGGNPLACRTALTVLETLEQQDLSARAEQLGQRMLEAFRETLRDLPEIQAIRGKGLMLGIMLDRPCGKLMQAALAERLLINVTAGNVIRLLPPLIISDKEADIIITKIDKLIRAFLKNG
ncbi:aspartate aminotransferase family protein [Nitrosococcus oceani]|uniref:aspartate aminotransferase family protein n=1 Tax=Nitrosococcus oceani TaxID=1229 RepID=UPI0004E8DF7F|nr:aspartate aminotransferase family protein [Nitrosococcus oceani]KFI21945.1 acetylornithine aminotransferase [Nitrosococcus oceani]